MPLQENIAQQQGSAGAARQEELLDLRRLVTRTEVRLHARNIRSGVRILDWPARQGLDRVLRGHCAVTCRLCKQAPTHETDKL